MYGLSTYMKGEKWPHSMGNGLVNMPILHGSYGFVILRIFQVLHGDLRNLPATQLQVAMGIPLDRMPQVRCFYGSLGNLLEKKTHVFYVVVSYVSLNFHP